MKSSRSILALTLAGCVAAVGAWCLTPAAAAFPGPAARPTPTSSPAPGDKTVDGNFQSSDGNKGTFVETFAASGTTTTDTIVYTLSGSTETSTDILTVTTNTDGSRIVVYSDLAFGATVPFTSTTTFTAPTDGDSVGTGTFTAADGTGGTLASIVTKDGSTTLTSTDYTNTSTGLTRELRLDERGMGADATKTIDVSPAGTLTTTLITRFGGMHHQHP